MSNIDPIPFAHHLIAPPMEFPFGLRSGGSIFGAPRDGGACYRCHEGIDLFPKGSPPHNDSIYAVNWGVVESVVDHNGSGPDWEIVIRHHPVSSGVYTLYRHLISVEPSIGPNAQVNAGDLIGRIEGSLAEPHLHFLWARKTDPADPLSYTVSGHQVRNRIPLDPTPLLYRFEAFRWPNRGGDHVPRYQHEDSYPYSKINRIRAISWQYPRHESRSATWLLQVAMPDRDNPPSGDEYFFLPINDALPHEKLMADVIRDAFYNGSRVRLGWRDSFFYGERRMIEDIRVRP